MHGTLSTHDIRNFGHSFSIGLVHGFINRQLEDPDEKLNLELHTTTFLAATALESHIHSNRLKDNRSALWGHAIGQLITESIILKNGGIVQIAVRPNTTLILAFLISTKRLFF